MMIKRISSVLLMALATWGINVKAYDSGVNVGDLLKHGGTVVKAAQHLRKGVTDITPEEEHYIGRAVAAQILGRYPPNKAQGVTDYLNTIGRYLTYY
ncbi:MAG: hypothetical protein GY731_07950, partial [Gammaproteobacteria bacterium]|nr:hypothetical protein [Gammaproteobacteria bacterium]